MIDFILCCMSADFLKYEYCYALPPPPLEPPCLEFPRLHVEVNVWVVILEEKGTSNNYSNQYEDMTSTKDKFTNPNRFHDIIYKGNIII